MKIKVKIDGKKRKVDLVNDIGFKNNEISEMKMIFKPTKIELPKTFEEYQQITGCKFDGMAERTYHGNGHYNISVKGDNEKEYKYTALRKLEKLRDHYNDGWKPDWNNKNIKMCIYKYENKIQKHNSAMHSNWFLAFKTQQLRDKFLKYFKELIESAEDLI